MSKKAFSNSPAAMGKQMAQHLTNSIISAAVEAVEALGKEPKFKHDYTYRAINKLRNALDLFGPQECKLPTFGIPTKTTHFQSGPVDPAEKHFPELGINDTCEWEGYIIIRAGGAIDRVGYIVTSLGCNVMPGAVWFSTVADAKKGIAALVLSKENPDLFWMFLELSKK